MQPGDRLLLVKGHHTRATTGLREIDANQEKQLTKGELSDSVRSQVKEAAALDGREQTPELQGERDRVLVLH